MRAVILTACLLWAVPAQAGFKLPASLLAITGAADIASTFVSPSGYESNVFLEPLNKPMGLVGTVSVGAAVEVAAVALICLKTQFCHTKAGKVLLFAAAGAHAYFAVDNAVFTIQQRRRR